MTQSYNRDAVNKSIASANRHNSGAIGPGEAEQIHRLLSGRRGPKPKPEPLAENSGEGPGGRAPAATMSKERFVSGLARLGYNISTADQLLGCGRSTIYRMADGTSKVPQVVMRLMDMYERHGIPAEHRR